MASGVLCPRCGSLMFPGEDKQFRCVSKTCNPPAPRVSHRKGVSQPFGNRQPGGVMETGVSALMEAAWELLGEGETLRFGLSCLELCKKLQEARGFKPSRMYLAGALNALVWAGRLGKRGVTQNCRYYRLDYGTGVRDFEADVDGATPLDPDMVDDESDKEVE